MLQIKKILIPTDYSACAERAFTHAAHLADRYGAELHVLSVLEEPDADPDRLDFSVTEEEVDEQLHILKAEEALRPAGSGQRAGMVEVQLKSASIPEGVLGYAEQHEVDLIVMGTHGRRGMDRLLLGSVAEEVVRRAAVPVFTVCEGAEQHAPDAVASILVPVDFSRHAKAALAYARALAADYGAEVEVLHVIEEAILPSVYGIEPASPGVPEIVAKTRQDLLQTFLKEAGREAAEVHVVVGHPASGILDFAKDRDVDLVVIATHGRTGVKRLLLGSVAERVVRGASCPVFTVKSFGKSLLVQPDGATSREEGYARAPDAPGERPAAAQEGS